MITIHELPALRLLLSFIVGIVFAPLFAELSNLYIFYVFLVSSVITSIFAFITFRYNVRYLSTILQFLMGTSISIIILTLMDPVRNDVHLVNQSKLNDSTLVEIIATCTDPVKHKKNYQIPVEVEWFRIPGTEGYIRTQGKVLLFSNDLTKVLNPGDKLLIKTFLKDPRKNKNENTFDYQAYLRRQGIFKTGFISDRDISLVENDSQFNLKRKTLEMRNWLLDRTYLLLGNNENADLSCGILKLNFSFVIFVVLVLAGTFTLSAQNQQKTYQKSSCKIKWYSIDEVTELSKSKKKKILIDLYTDWCGWCKVMDKNTFTNEDIATYINKHYYPVKLNAECKEDISFNEKVYSYISTKGRGYNEFALELTGGKLSYPSVIFIDEDMKIIQPIQGYQEAKDFIKIVKYFGEDHYKNTPWTVFEQSYSK